MKIINFIIVVFFCSNFLPSTLLATTKKNQAVEELIATAEVFDFSGFSERLRNLNSHNVTDEIVAKLFLAYHKVRLGLIEPENAFSQTELKFFFISLSDYTTQNATEMSSTAKYLNFFFIIQNPDFEKIQRLNIYEMLLETPQPNNEIAAWVGCSMALFGYGEVIGIRSKEQSLRYVEQNCDGDYNFRHLVDVTLLREQLEKNASASQVILFAAKLQEFLMRNVTQVYDKFYVVQWLAEAGLKINYSEISLNALSQLNQLINRQGLNGSLLQLKSLLFSYSVASRMGNQEAFIFLTGQLSSFIGSLSDRRQFYLALDTETLWLTSIFERNALDRDLVGDATRELLVRWQNFSNESDYLIGDVRLWILIAPYLSELVYDKINPQNGITILQELLTIYYERAKYLRFEVEEIENSSSKNIADIARQLNDLIDPINNFRDSSSDTKEIPSALQSVEIFSIHAQLAVLLSNSGRDSEAKLEYEKAWQIMPEQLKGSSRDSLNLLSELAYQNIINQQYAEAMDYSLQAVQNFRRILNSNSSGTLITQLENDISVRSDLAFAIQIMDHFRYEGNFSVEDRIKIDQAAFEAIQMLRTNRITMLYRMSRRSDPRSKVQGVRLANDVVNQLGKVSDEIQSNLEVDWSLISDEFQLQSLNSFQLKIPRDTALVFAYDAGYNTRFAYLETFNFYPIFAEIDNKQLTDKLEKLNKSLQLSSSTGELADFDFDSSTWLHDNIFRSEKFYSPFENVDHIKNLIFFPSKTTFNLPLGLLHNGNKTSLPNLPEPDYDNQGYLIDHLYISNFIDVDDFLVSNLFDTFLQEQAKFIPVSAKHFLGLSNPNFNGISETDLRAVNFVEKMGSGPNIVGFPALPETSEEIAVAANYFHEGRVQILEKFEATKSTLLEQDLASFDVLMFSTHGLAPGSIPSFNESALVFGVPSLRSETFSFRDALLTPGEILSFNLNADLVILNACETGLPDMLNAPGLTGLAQSFLAAGSSAVMVTNWPISSKTTVDLTTLMFQNLHEDPSLSFNAALVMAQREIKKNRNMSHPFFWAPYSIFGNF